MMATTLEAMLIDPMIVVTAGGSFGLGANATREPRLTASTKRNFRQAASSASALQKLSRPTSVGADKIAGLC
jgi:hypothetical protein